MYARSNRSPPRATSSPVTPTIQRRVAVQVLRIASEYDDLTVRDHIPDVALESLRSAPGYVYDERVLASTVASDDGLSCQSAGIFTGIP